MRIIGIDPGLARVGYGIIDVIGGKKIMLDCGIIETQSTQKEESRLIEISNDFFRNMPFYSKIEKIIKE